MYTCLRFVMYAYWNIETLLYLACIRELNTQNPRDINPMKMDVHSVVIPCIQGKGDVMLTSSKLNACIPLYLNTSVTSIYELNMRKPYDISLVKIELYLVITQCMQGTGDVMLISSKLCEYWIQ